MSDPCPLTLAVYAYVFAVGQASNNAKHKLPLATRNVKDFKSIEGLIVLNPWINSDQ